MTDAVKNRSARLGHVKRQLRRGEPLTGDHLTLALALVGDRNTGDELRDGIANKLKTGQKLGDYELHLMLNVFWLHARLKSAASLR